MATKKQTSECQIWGPIAQFPDRIGYPGAGHVNHVALGDQSGFVDLVLIPNGGPVKLVLIEAKAVKGASEKVVGQLLKYYAHALDLGGVGLDALKKVAAAPGRSDRPGLLSFKELLGAPSLAEAQRRCTAGVPLRPSELHLIVALDAEAPRLEPRLVKTARVLFEHHRVPLSVVVVGTKGRVTWLFRAGAR